MKKLTRNILTPIAAGLCLSFCFLANNVQANVLYWDNNGTGTPSSGVWDATSLNWASGSALTASTVAWNPADAAVFTAGGTSAGAIEVDVNTANLGTAGIFNNGIAGSSCNLTLGGTGSLSLNAGDDAFYVSSGKSTTVNTVLTGAGILDAQSTGSLFLNAANSYTGGTYLGNNGNTLLYFNNNSAFGSGDITLNRTANYSTLLGQGGSALALVNNVSINAVNTGGVSTGLHFANAANTPVTFSGTWSLGTVNLILKADGGSGSSTTLSGAISGSGGLIVTSGTAGSKIILSGQSTGYTGATTVEGTGYTYGGAAGVTGILQFGVANATPNSTGMTLAGGTLAPGGHDQIMAAAVLTLSGGGVSTIDFSDGAALLEFADSHGATWSGTLNLIDYSTDGSTYGLDFGADGLTAGQLADIEFDGAGLGDAYLTPDGFITVPEPSSTALLGMIGGLVMVWNLRHRKA